MDQVDRQGQIEISDPAKYHIVWQTGAAIKPKTEPRLRGSFSESEHMV